MSQELMETAQLKVMTVGEAQREHYLAMRKKFESEGPKIIAGIKNEDGAKRAAAWRLEVREHLRAIDDGPLGIRSAELFRAKKEVDAAIMEYTGKCEDLMKKAKTEMDRWYTQEAARIRIANEKARKKDLEKAEQKQTEKVQLLMDMGKPKAAMAEAKKPLTYTPKILEMPKIPHAVWAKKFVIEIEDFPAVLKHIAKDTTLHAMIDREFLIAKLEALAKTLDGNMQKFPGVKCYQTPTSSTVGGPK